MLLLKSSFARYGSVLRVSTCQEEDLREWVNATGRLQQWLENHIL